MVRTGRHLATTRFLVILRIACYAVSFVVIFCLI